MVLKVLLDNFFEQILIEAVKKHVNLIFYLL